MQCLELPVPWAQSFCFAKLQTITPHISSSFHVQVILGDQTEQFSLTYGGCMAVNPGSFSSDYSFVVYRPSSKEIEFSKVPA